MKKYLTIIIAFLFIVIDFFEFHDLLEPKTLPQFLTGLASILFFILLGSNFLNKTKE